MKRSLLLVLLLWAMQPSLAQTQKIEIALSLPGKPYSLDVNLLHGSIHLTKHAGKHVLIEVRNAKPAQPVSRDGMRRITADGEDLTVEENNNQIKVIPGLSQRSIQLVIHAPDDGHFVLKTVNSGNIVVENLQGEFELTNVNGRIALTNVGGSAIASTINGRIQASFTQVKQGAPMAFSTLNGSIDLSFPPTFNANLRAKTDRGEVLSDYEVGALKNEGNVNKTVEKGMTRIESTRWITATINQGGPELMVKTVNGNIYLRRNK